MKTTTIKRHFGPKSVSKDRTMEFVDAQHTGKVLHDSDFKKVRMSEQIRLPCCDATQRFGKIPESS